MILKPEPRLSLPDSLAAGSAHVIYLRTMRRNQQLGEGRRLLEIFFHREWFGFPLCFLNPSFTLFLHGQLMPCPHLTIDMKATLLGIEEQKLKKSGSLKALNWSQYQLWSSSFQMTSYIRKINPYLEVTVIGSL